MTRKVESWLARLSDPIGPNAQWRPPPFSPGEGAKLEALLDEAGRHNVRPAVVRNLGLQLRDNPDSFMPDGGRALTELQARAADLRVQDVARAALLAHLAREILAAIAAAGLPAVLVKGLDFAEVAYGGIQNRTFSDIDLLVRPEAMDSLGVLLTGLGYSPEPIPKKRIGHTEWKWTRRNAQWGAILVELHTDLVHGPEWRGRVSLTYDLYADPVAGGISPAARMVLAALHGATSHLFGRLQYVVDGLMIARMEVDAEELRERARRSGAVLPVATMLRLAAELYGCEKSRALVGRLGTIPWGSLERRLITVAMVLSAKSPNRWRLLPQRYLYRRLLRGGPSSA
jgi:hypothetical protein